MKRVGGDNDLYWIMICTGYVLDNDIIGVILWMQGSYILDTDMMGVILVDNKKLMED